MIEAYIAHWWAGDLAAHYSPLGLQMSQFNKLFRIAQYATGFVAIFEFVQFRVAMNQLKWASHAALFLYRFLNLILNLPNFLGRLSLALLLWVTRQRRLLESLKSAFVTHLFSARDRAARSASRSLLVRGFAWLEQHPIPDPLLKATTFALFVILSFGEILTSV